MESRFDLDRYRDRDDVDFEEETATVDREEFQSVSEDYDSHVVVGVTNDEGMVLLVNDGTHGWTLPAIVLDPDDDPVEIGRRGVEGVTGVEVEIARPVRVRRIEYRLAGDGERQTAVYSVIYRSNPVTGRPIADEPLLGDRIVEDVGWFDEVPEDQVGPVADDIRLFVDNPDESGASTGGRT